MKIAYISGNLPHYDRGLRKLIEYTQNIFSELGVETSELNLGMVHPPYFDGVKNTHLDGMLGPVRTANGLVLVCSATLFSPSAIMQTFLEYLTMPAYGELFKGKHCALVVVSESGGERAALNSLSRVVQHLGGYDTIQIGLQATHLNTLDTNTAVRDFIERELEDFYRAMRQNRVRIIPQDYAQGGAVSVGASGTPYVNNPGEPMNKRLDAFTEQQERDIEELSRLFAEKYDENDEDEIIDDDEGVLLAPITPLAAAPTRKKTARQLTQSLPHYFQPQLSAGTQAVMQINITGVENFEGYLNIRGKECTYTDGVFEDPDVTVIADAGLWMDVLNAKFTAQKAFMIGGLKVRGALALFTKFDTLFKLN